jgi:hypothetical protein
MFIQKFITRGRSQRYEVREHAMFRAILSRGVN